MVDSLEEVSSTSDEKEEFSVLWGRIDCVEFPPSSSLPLLRCPNSSAASFSCSLAARLAGVGTGEGDTPG